LDSELKAYILSLKGINNDEKQKLIEAEKIVQPIYKQIDSLIDDANKAGKNTEKQIDELNNKIYEIQSEDNEIMERVYKYEEAKLIDNMDEDSYNIDMIEYIKSLPILTDSEKDKLIDTHKKLAPYYEQLDSLYKKLNKIQKPIIDKIDKLYDKVDEGYKDVAYIWNKVEY
jgi:chromosome segregation ATPase